MYVEKLYCAPHQLVATKAVAIRTRLAVAEVAKTHLQAPTLMMQIMENGPIVVHKPERIQRKHVSAVIANRLDGRERAEYHALAHRKLGNLACQDEAEDVEEESFEPVGVYGAVSVRDVDAVVLGVHKPCEKNP